MDKNPRHPGERLRELLITRGWTQDTLATVTGRNRATISNIISGRTGVSADMALALAAVFGNEPQEWLRWSTEWDLARARGASTDEVVRRARIFEFAPIRDLKKRGWIRDTENLSELEQDLEALFGAPLDQGVTFPVAARKAVSLSELNVAERAWCFRARQLARIMPVKTFSHAKLATLEQRLRQLAAFPKEARKLAPLLASSGIRFVVIEPLPGARIDGAAFWLDEHSPVIAVSIRFDRIDALWFTVMHEFAHIKNGDSHSMDTDLLRDDKSEVSVVLAEDKAEKRANEEAANSLVPKVELDSLVRRVGPLYSSTRIVQFAHKIKMHPGIIVGQLQHRGELGYSAFREFLVKIRSIVTETALTDGWGQSIGQGLF